MKNESDVYDSARLLIDQHGDLADREAARKAMPFGLAS